eukprot:gb/GEZN01003637.1/.p1 GENE.gb/GEZN01003637.1/~~gb/GEZN01003637.1/.p1  ORF type:complete len:509 (-),score=84.28 gb/GEZN01003637.1/:507-2033(-)
MTQVAVPLIPSLLTYFGFMLLIVWGRIRDFFRIHALGLDGRELAKPGYAPIVYDFNDFYTRRLYKRMNDCWNRPICSAAGTWIEVMERKRKKVNIFKTTCGPLELNGQSKKCLNLGSYNYLGFGDPNSSTQPWVFAAVDRYGSAACSTRNNIGTTRPLHELEQRISKFVGKEDALVYGMGFGTNSTGIPALVHKGCLIISDELNHSSLVSGCRLSGATTRVFRHNDMEHLERVIRRAILDGQPRSHRPWKKIVIMVEGIYSMEGEISPLEKIVAVKKKYGCYLYLDEAHSIGALGDTGRGCCEKRGVDPADVEILMGTFTKSFGGVGGYIAGDAKLIRFLRKVSAGYVYSSSISPPTTQQIISAFQIIQGEDGTSLGRQKLDSLKANSNYFRKRMREIGCMVLGDEDSPVVPVMILMPTKLVGFSRLCLANNLAVVVVGYPATPLLLARARFCISAAHTIEDLEEAVRKLRNICEIVGIRYGVNSRGYDYYLPRPTHLNLDISYEGAK